MPLETAVWYLVLRRAAARKLCQGHGDSFCLQKRLEYSRD